MITGKELAAEIGVTPQALSKAARKGHRCAGHPVSEWAVRDEKRWIEGYQPPLDVIDGAAAAAAAAGGGAVDPSRVNPVDRRDQPRIHMSPAVRAMVDRNRRRRAEEGPVDPEAPVDGTDELAGQAAESVGEVAADDVDEADSQSSAAWVLGGLAVAIGLPWLLSSVAQNTAAGVDGVQARLAVNSPLGNRADGAPARQLGESVPTHQPRPIEPPRTLVGVQLPPLRIWN